MDAMEILAQKSFDVKFDLSGTHYVAIENIGTGAYGVVCSAIDNAIDGRKVAIKKVPNALGAVTLTKRTLREVKILQQFEHENILSVLDIFRAQSDDSGDVYIVFDLMQTDLHQIIHSKQLLTDKHIQYFLYQILRGLKYIHSAAIVHRDLKPSNLMVNADCLLKIGDFGMARTVKMKNQEPDAMAQDAFMTQYVATRWYRAPELLFSMLDYSLEVDLWSVGCILAEMLNRRQLFPGRDYISQLKLIVCYLGTPREEIMKAISSDIVKRIIHGLGPKTPLPWSSILPKASPSAVSMVASFLRMAPWERLSAADALDHPYLADFRDPTTEITAPSIVDLSLDVESLDADQLKQAMLAQAEKYQHPRNCSLAPSANEVDASPQPPAMVRVPLPTDVEMLSAKLKDSSIGESECFGAPDASLSDAKQRLKEKLLHGRNSQPSTSVVVTAQRRYQEREEKRRKRAEKSAEKQRRVQDGVETSNMTQHDRSLLERWHKLRENADKTQSSPPEASFGDLIIQAMPNAEIDADTAKQLNSAELYKLWKEAASMNGVNPEELLEKDWPMNSS